jgi:hypothetical protein
MKVLIWLVPRWPVMERLSPLLTPIDVPADWNFLGWASSRHPSELTTLHFPGDKASWSK